MHKKRIWRRYKSSNVADANVAHRVEDCSRSSITLMLAGFDLVMILVFRIKRAALLLRCGKLLRDRNDDPGRHVKSPFLPPSTTVGRWLHRLLIFQATTRATVCLHNCALRCSSHVVGISLAYHSVLNFRCVPLRSAVKLHIPGCDKHGPGS